MCKKHGKTVIYTTIGKPRENDPLYPVYVQFERFRAAQYSRELSDKVWRGCVKIAEQGYWAGTVHLDHGVLGGRGVKSWCSVLAL